MLTRRTFILAGAVVTATAVTLPALAENAPRMTAFILGATAVTRVYGDGLRLVAVAIRYDRALTQDALNPALFSVADRQVTRVYIATSPDPASAADEGDHVILDLSPEDPAARLFLYAGASATRLPAAATTTIRTVQDSGTPTKGPPDFTNLPRSVATDRVLGLVTGDFTQALFEDRQTGDALRYNLFVPKQQTRPLPLVVFMHDAGNTSSVIDQTLIQGLGATGWVGAADQARNPAIVLAPQYDAQVVDDASQASSMLETTLNLIEKIATTQNVDRNRIYLTGQSGGGMLAIAMMIRQPELAAAALLVACQWDPALVKPLARQNLWVVVSEGDIKAYPGQQAIMQVIEAEGTPVSRAVWDGTSDAAVLAADVLAQANEGRTVNFTALRKGTVVPPDQSDDPGANHVNTWRIAYDIPALRDWIMRQHRNG